MGYRLYAVILLDPVLLLYVLCSVAGLIMVIGGIWLLAKQKIYIDHETQQPIEIELPGRIRFRANVPALALFVVGFIPLWYPVHRLDLKTLHHVEHATITGTFDPQTDAVFAYVSGIHDELLEGRGGEFQISAAPFDLDEKTDYKILLLSSGYVLGEARASWSDVKDGKVTLAIKTTTTRGNYKKAEVDPVPAEFLPKK